MNNDFGIVSRVYVLPDEQGRVTRIKGEYSLPANLTDCVLRSDEEIAAEQAAMLETAPSQLDKLEAQVVYTAMMIDTLMET